MQLLSVRYWPLVVAKCFKCNFYLYMHGYKSVSSQVYNLKCNGGGNVCEFLIPVLVIENKYCFFLAKTSCYEKLANCKIIALNYFVTSITCLAMIEWYLNSIIDLNIFCGDPRFLSAYYFNVIYLSYCSFIKKCIIFY